MEPYPCRGHVRPLRLGAAPEQRIPILLAALAPSSVRLAGELADHWLPFLWARSMLPAGRALLAEGEAAGERSTATSVAASVPPRDRSERGGGQADRRWLASRVPDPYGSAVSANAAGLL